MRRHAFRLTGALLFLTVSAPAVLSQTSLVRFHKVHRAMGTEFALDLYAPDEQTADQLAESAFEEIDRLEALLSNYRPSSELSRISREAGAGPVTTDPETFAFLQRAFYWSRESGGAFDITVGPLLRAWGFFFHHGRIPSEAELTAVRVGWEKVSLDPVSRTVTFKQGQRMELDPGSIGKGFAVDKVVALLRYEGVTAAFLSAGGSTLYGIGAPPGTEGWTVNVPDPHHPGQIASTILLRDESLSTGACTEKFFIKNGHRYCHIFDPQTMRPVEEMLQATVVDPSATDSDALSTVAFVLSPEASQEFFAYLTKTRVLLFPAATSQPPCVAIKWQGDPCHRSSAQRAKEPHR